MRRRYSDEERANALVRLDLNGGALRRTARELGIPWSTLAEWAQGRVSANCAAYRTEKKAALLADLEEIVEEVLGLLLEKLPQASAHSLAVILGIAIDKMRLLEEGPMQAAAVEPPLSEEERSSASKRSLSGRGCVPAPDWFRDGRTSSFSELRPSRSGAASRRLRAALGQAADL